MRVAGGVALLALMVVFVTDSRCVYEYGRDNPYSDSGNPFYCVYNLQRVSEAILIATTSAMIVVARLSKDASSRRWIGPLLIVLGVLIFLASDTLFRRIETLALVLAVFLWFASYAVGKAEGRRYNVERERRIAWTDLPKVSTAWICADCRSG